MFLQVTEDDDDDDGLTPGELKAKQLKAQQDADLDLARDAFGKLYIQLML